jgi:hypothetical protein
MARTGSPGFVDLLLMELMSLSATTVAGGTVIVPDAVGAAGGGPVGACAADIDAMRSRATIRNGMIDLRWCDLKDSEAQVN